MNVVFKGFESRWISRDASSETWLERLSNVELMTMLFVHSLVLLVASASALRLGQTPSHAQAARHASPRAVAPLAEDAPSGDMERLEVRTDAARTEGAMSFEALGVSVPGVAANLAAANITAPNALQRATFGPISSGRDAIIHAWTGSGKTLAFLLPLFELLDASSREPQALVLCQSRELAFQIARVAELALAGTGLGVAAVVGGANPNNQLEKIKKNRPQLIVGTPGRVNDLAFEWQKLKLQRVRHIVIDEVDDALRPPHLDPTLRLIESAQDGRPLQLIFASATADTAAVRRAATQLLRKPMLVRLLPAAGVASDAAAQLPEGITHGLCVVEERKVCSR